MILNFLSPTELASIEADLIIENGTDIYLCWCSRDNGAPDMSANTWKIRKVETNTITIAGVSVTATKNLYPNGSKKYDFSPNSINDYSFEYAR